MLMNVRRDALYDLPDYDDLRWILVDSVTARYGDWVIRLSPRKDPLATIQALNRVYSSH